MNPKLITYQKFNDIALAEQLAEILKLNEINYIIEEQSFNFDPSFAMKGELSKDYAVKILAEDFAKANQLLIAIETESVETLAPDYYLNSFTNDELINVLAKADEWSAYDVVNSRKILGDRGVVVSDEAIAEINQTRLEALGKPEPSQTTWIVIGYLFALLGGILGVFIGWHLAFHTKTLPNGEKVYGYRKSDRLHGRIILYLSVAMFFFFSVLQIVRTFNEG